MIHIFIFHRDLRLIDNTTLIYQTKTLDSHILPIFIFPPEQIDPKKNKYFSDASVQFMIESLHELSSVIKKKKSKLLFFKGDTLTVLKSIHKMVPVQSIGFNIDYTPYARQRDGIIKKWCDDNNIVCFMKEDYSLHQITEKESNKEDGTPYLVYTPFYRNCINNLTVRPVDKFKSFKFKRVPDLDKNKYLIEEKEIDNFYKANDKINVHGGRDLGLKILNNLEKFKNKYEKCRDFFTYKTTFLSAYLKFNAVSIRETYYKMVKTLGKKCGLIRELYFRDFYMTVTYNFPHILVGQITGKNVSYRREYDKIKWTYDKDLYQKWSTGTTGFPVVDSGMRQLNTINYQQNRLRMVCSSWLIKDAHLDWRLGETYYASKLVDYDPINNYHGWTWSGGMGTDAQPWFRLMNPWTQQQDYDPKCEFIYQWIEELKDVPMEDIHNWWKPEVHEKWIKLGVKYPKPCLDHKTERLETLRLYREGLK